LPTLRTPRCNDDHMPNTCSKQQDQYASLMAQLQALQAQLTQGNGGNKPQVLGEIEELLPEVRRAKAALDQCRAENPPLHPPSGVDVTKIEWTIQTGNHWWSGTDSPVRMEVYRDDVLLQRLRLEPGRTSRLDRGELKTYFWQFVDPSGIGVIVGGTVVPYTIPFPNGIRGHLRVKFITLGDDAWEKVSIVSDVFSGELKHVPGTIDELVWVETWDTFRFPRDIVLSLDRDEGFSAFTLLY
jgi:hypothetical protein